jgi:hypothetical protein
MGGEAEPLGAADAHPHPALPHRGGGTSAAPDDNIGAEQYWGEVGMEEDNVKSACKDRML